MPGQQRFLARIIVGAMGCLLCGGAFNASAQTRVLGLDISAWQSGISQTTWNNLVNVENRQFVILRSSRGGTTGYYDQNDSDNSNGKNTLSQRYDDPYYVQNMNRSTTAGMFAGSYHFTRPDIVASTLNSGGIANTGADEADHFIQMAGAFMRPGYLMPVHDLEAGDGIRTDEQITQFCVDFADRIYQRMGIRPGIYINGNYAANILQTASAGLRQQLLIDYPTLWSARWPNQTNPEAIDVQNEEPKDTYSAIYGPWDDGGVTHPWRFWQYASTGRLQSFNNGGSNLDMDVARGGLEFLKDCLIPAVWMNDSDGDWGTLTNWNSGQTAVAPVTGAGQVAPIGTQTLPTPRRPGASGSGVTSGQYDTVILDRPNSNITVTYSSGTNNIRKLYMREALKITGGNLAINYVPSADSTTNAAEFSGPVLITNSAVLSFHTLQVDPTNIFTLGGGTVNFLKINLMPNSTVPAKISVTGNVTLNTISNLLTAVITNGAGSGSSGVIDLAGANRTLTIGSASADVDLSIDVPMTNGGLIKAGGGTLRVTKPNGYSGVTTISAGRLLVNNSTGTGTGSSSVTVNGGMLGGTGIIAGTVFLNSGGTLIPGGGTNIGTLTLGIPPVLSGTNFLKLDRNGGASRADKLVVSTGTLTYGGTLVLTNVGAALVGGEVFTNFAASSYAGAFAVTNAPVLTAGLNWYFGDLTANGRIKVNRSPTTTGLTFTNITTTTLQIPINSLLTNSSDLDGDSLSLASVTASTNGITPLTNGGFLTYSNSVGVADRFNYTISDGHGGSATGIITIVPSPEARFKSALGMATNAVTVHVAGRAGWTYFLERSTNLPVWLTISTNVAPGNGTLDIIDDFRGLAKPPSSAIYRLRWAP